MLARFWHLRVHVRPSDEGLLRLCHLVSENSDTISSFHHKDPLFWEVVQILSLVSVKIIQPSDVFLQRYCFSWQSLGKWLVFIFQKGMCKCFLPKYRKRQLYCFVFFLYFKPKAPCLFGSVALALKGAVSVSSHFANFHHFATFNIMTTFRKLKDMSRKMNMQHQLFLT